MFFSDWSNKKEEEEKNKKKKQQEQEQEQEQSFADWSNENHGGKEEEEDIAPVRIDANVATPFGAGSALHNKFDLSANAEHYASQQNNTEDDSLIDLFDKGAFSAWNDGFDVSDGKDWAAIPHAILGTAGDALTGVVKGFGSFAEGIADLAGYGIYEARKALGETEADLADYKKRISESTMDAVFGDTEERLDDYSVLGRTSNALAQGAGQLAALIAGGEVLGSLGSMAMMGASSFGGGMSEAYQGGATDEEAVTYGVLSAATEIFFEKLFGGIKIKGFEKGLSSLDDVTAKAVSKFAKSQTGKNVVQWLVKGGFEGLEELGTGAVQALAKQRTYMSEGDLLEILENENLFEQFFVGMLLGDISQVNSLRASNKAGVDFITGNTQNEQAVIDKEVENRIAEAEKDGKKLSGREKTKILDDVVQAMKRGYIDTDTIEEVLGGDSYKAYKDSVDSENALKEELEFLQEEYKPLYEMKGSDKSDAQIDRQAELKNRIAEIKAKLASEDTKAQREQLKTKLGEDVSKLVQNDRLAESYLNKARVNEDFKPDFEKYKGTKHEDAAKKTIENAIKAGANNTNQVHDLVDMAADLSSETGYVYDFKSNDQIKNDFIERKTKEIATLEAIENRTAAQNEKIAKLKDIVAKVQSGKVTVNGNVDSNGIVLNLDSQKPLNRIIGHEITHTVEKAKHYEALRDALFDFAKSKGVDIEAELEMKALEYEGVEGTTAEAELVADLVGDYLFTDSDFVKTLSTKNRNLAQRIYDEIKYFLTKATKGSKEERELLKVKHEFEKAFRESAEKNTADGGVKYSLIGRTADGSGIYKTNYQADTPKSVKQAELIDLVQNVWSSKPITLTIVEDGQYTDITAKFNPELSERSDLSKIAFGNRKGNAAERRMTLDLASDLYQIASEAKFNYSKDATPKPNNPAHDGVTKYHYFLTNLVYKDNDGNYIQCHMNIDVKRNAEGDWFYSFAIEKGSVPQALLAAVTEDSATLPDNNIPYMGNVVKTQFSLSESDNAYLDAVNRGDTETAQKMADEAAKNAGYNVKVFHGTDAFGFTKLDVSKSDDGISFFATDSLETANTYSRGNTLESRRLSEVQDSDYLKGKDSFSEEDVSNIAKNIAEFMSSEIGIDNYVDSNALIDPNLTDFKELNKTIKKWMHDLYETKYSKERKNGVFKRYKNFEAFELSDKGTELRKKMGVYKKQLHRLCELKNGTESGIYDLYANTENHLVVECGNTWWREIDSTDLPDIRSEEFKKYKRLDESYWTTRSVAVYAKDNGYSGVTFKNLKDFGGNGIARNPATVYIFFNPQTQVKSADPVTYDDTGNVIPLSERFNVENDDIRYSLSDSNGKALSNEQAEFFKDSKARDENGNLKVVYHGTRNADFTVFKQTATYFTDNKEMADSYSPNGDMYEGYVNITKPYEIDAQGEKWSKIPIDDATRKFLQEYGSSVFKEDGTWRTSPADIVSAIEEAVDNGDMDYDGIIIRNIDDTGSYYKGKDSHLATDYIVFNSNQFKNTDNKAPTSDPDIRYSLSDSEGRKLSPAVQNRFAKSKVVDEDGNLKAVYHGTASGEFTIFDKSKGSVEGDFGSGFYFTDNAYDVSNNYEGGGADFENKVARLAERIEQDEDISYAEAEARARDELYKGSHKFEVYLNIENPAVVGETTLLDYESFAEEYNREDYDSDEDYESDVEYLISDKIDEIIWEVEKNVDVYSTDGLSEVLWNAVNEGGIDIEQLKANINNLYLEDSEGNLVGNEVTRQVIESLGYDGIIDPTVSGKWNMDMEEGTTHYIVFKPNQIKSVTNENPTDNPDINMSLSSRGEQFAPIGKNDFFGKDFRKQSADDIAPVAKTAVPANETVDTVEDAPVVEDDIAPVAETIDAESVMADRDSFMSQKAMELYKEITSLKKGVRASKSLGYLLDHGHDWRSIKTALLNIRDNPNQVVNPNSAAETVAREMLGREYDDMVAELAEPSDVAEGIRTKMQHIQTEIANNEKLREQSNMDYDSEIAEVQAEYDAKKNKNTIVANDLLRRIERLNRMKNTNDANYAKRISDLEARIEKMSQPTYKRAVQRKAKQTEYTNLMENLVGDTSTWVDKKLGISYKVNTLRRNLRDVVRDADGKRDIAKADAIYDELQGKYNHNEAELKRESRRIKAVFADLNLNHAEDTYAHMLGEFRHNPDTKLSEEAVKEFYEKHKNSIDTAKVDKAIEESRKTFDELIVRVNERLKEQGMKEISYRQGYFPHFTNPKQGWLAKLLNWKTVDTEIPTSIAGLTETFNPERSWQGFSKQRKTDTTDYSLEQGLDTYIHGALDWIYHIEDIQKRRALENHIRYTHSEEGVKEAIDKIRNSEELDADEMQEQIDLVYAKANNPLNNFVTNLRAGTNTLANKKSENDRQIESDTNRKIYSVMTNLNNRINANMVVGSVSSALTNFIPITQSWMEVSPVYSFRGMKDTIKSTIRDDGIVNKSDFLTNRLMNEENLHQTFWDKASEKAAFMMEAIDSFTSQTVWRSKYLQNISEGMSETEAIKNADQFAENVIAGRSRGNQPTIFDAKNPITKIFTAFQLEVNNQYGYFFKDAPQDSKNKARLIKGYATAFLGAYVYNALYSSLVGRDAAFDPISILEDLFRDMGLFGDDEEEEPEDILLNLGENILQEVPFVGGLIGGGRIPISSAIPYGGDIKTIVSNIADGEASTKEWLKPVYYLAMPFGGGQIKKTNEGLGMFSDEHPVAGSYTDSGNLRFPVEDTLGNRIQAGLFGQYASENARDYFDNGRSPLKEKQIQEYIDVDIPIRDYWEYREGLADQKTIEDKFDYIAGLDLPVSKKNILINNIVDREEEVDLEGYEDFSSYEEFDFATKNPGKYAVSQAVGGFDAYSSYMDALGDIESDKDESGKSISGSKKEKVVSYINSLDIDYGMKIILFKSMYDSKEDRNNYNADIVEYLDSRDDISYEDMVTILTELGMRVEGNNVYWD